MFNVAVLRMRDVIKYFVGITLTIVIVISTSKYFSSSGKKENGVEKNNNKISLKLFTMSSLTKCLDKTIPTMSEVNEEYNKIEEENEKISTPNYLEQILQTQISSIKGIEEENIVKQEDNKNKDNEQKNEEQKTNDEVKLAQTTGVETQVITPNPIKESFNVQYGKVKIKNETTYNLTQELLTPDIQIDNKNVVIFHTHSCESYTPSDLYPYQSSGNYRTTDLNYTVTEVGTELEKHLKQYGINTIHDTSYHDYPSYTGSYTRSLETVQNILKTNQSDIIIDLHRDAIGSRADYAPSVKIGEDEAAQIMFVIGTNEGGLWHPNWNQNLKFAIKMQEKAEEMYPGLFKPIMLTKSRYNQHTGKYANIIEVGATGNTLEQCLNSMKYLSSVMNAVFSGN